MTAVLAQPDENVSQDNDPVVDVRLQMLRTLFRGLMAFRSYREAIGIDEIVDEHGSSWTIYDIEAAYRAAIREPASIGPFMALAGSVKPTWYVMHTGEWQAVTSVTVPRRSTIAQIELADGRIKRKSQEIAIPCMTPNRYRLMVEAKRTPSLPLRQRQAIDLYLVQNLPEKTVVEIMQIKPRNPIRMYATSGLRTLLHWMDTGVIPSLFGENFKQGRV